MILEKAVGGSGSSREAGGEQPAKGGRDRKTGFMPADSFPGTVYLMYFTSGERGELHELLTAGKASRGRGGSGQARVDAGVAEAAVRGFQARAGMKPLSGFCAAQV